MSVSQECKGKELSEKASQWRCVGSVQGESWWAFQTPAQNEAVSGEKCSSVCPGTVLKNDAGDTGLQTD